MTIIFSPYTVEKTKELMDAAEAALEFAVSESTRRTVEEAQHNLEQFRFLMLKIEAQPLQKEGKL